MHIANMNREMRTSEWSAQRADAAAVAAGRFERNAWTSQYVCVARRLAEVKQKGVVSRAVLSTSGTREATVAFGPSHQLSAPLFSAVQHFILRWNGRRLLVRVEESRCARKIHESPLSHTHSQRDIRLLISGEYNMY